MEAPSRDGNVNNCAQVFALEDTELLLRGICLLVESVDGLHWMHGSRDLPEALDYLHNYRPDIAVLDLELPGGSGIEALKLLRREHPNCRTIIFSGSVNAEVKERCLSAGASECFHKLTDIDKLLTTLRCWSAEFQQRRLSATEAATPLNQLPAG